MDIQVQDLQKVYGQGRSGRQIVAIEGLSLTLKASEFTCVVGRTGCGKSSFLKILSGLEIPNQGRVVIGGKEPYRNFDWFKGKIGCIFQSSLLLPWRTAIQNVELGLEFLNVPAETRHNRARRALTRFGLEDSLEAFPGELSGGMRQRVAMARAFALDPGILLADEAFGHLDEVTAKALRLDFLSAVREERKTLVLVTHHLEEAFEVADRVLVFGSPARLLGDFRPKDALQGSTMAELRTKVQGAIDENRFMEARLSELPQK